MPHYGHLLASTTKDVVPRFQTMRGKRVERVWGWDCHGLPIENIIEQKLQIKGGKKGIEKLGIDVFNAACRTEVLRLDKEWERVIGRLGRWVDFEHSYKTMDTSYMESVWWALKQTWDKGLVYEDRKVLLYCSRCETPISNFEVAMDADNYKEITEPAAVFMYQTAEDKDTYFLAWSTTPWNKIATPALAVNPKLTYVKVQQGKEKYILAKSTMKMLTNKPHTVLAEFSGETLVGKKFVPHYTFYKIDEGKKAFVVVPGDFVTADEGTGIVTIAAYGEEDLALMQKEKIQIVLHVDEEGVMKPDVPNWAGKYYLDVDPLVIEDLTKRGLLYRVDKYTHTVPTCWRCHTRLYYAPQDAWYVNVAKLKDRMKKTNEQVNWFPEHFKYGRYLKSLENAPDWCISRSRYWGSPVPVWECPKGHRFVPGSIKELEEASGTKITDLHKPEIDDVQVTCKECAEKAKRVTEVLDSWIEAGSAPFAERHYPFDTTLDLKTFFPPDFIVEYTGQIRAWFYVLHVIATALFDSQAFKNVLVTGVILGTDGRKMSKNFGNYPDPKEMIQKYGGDALRLYLLGAPVMHGEDIRISELEYRNQIRGILLLWWNVYNFFVTYATIDGWEPGAKEKSTKVMDRWIISRMNGNVKAMTEKGYEVYDTPEIVSRAGQFIRDVSLWYVRRIRDRVGPSAAKGTDKDDAYMTLWTVLTEYSKVLAPLIPFITEDMYRNLTGRASVHLESWPDSAPNDPKLEEDMEWARHLGEKAHARRKAQGVKVRVPLAALTYRGATRLPAEIEAVIMAETNVKKVVFEQPKGQKEFEDVSLDFTMTPELAAEGSARDLIREIQVLRKDKGCTIDARITVQLPSSYKEKLSGELIAYIQKETLAEGISWGDTLSLSTG